MEGLNAIRKCIKYIIVQNKKNYLDNFITSVSDMINSPINAEIRNELAVKIISSLRIMNKHSIEKISTHTYQIYGIYSDYHGGAFIEGTNILEIKRPRLGNGSSAVIYESKINGFPSITKMPTNFVVDFIYEAVLNILLFCFRNKIRDTIGIKDWRFPFPEVYLFSRLDKDTLSITIEPFDVVVDRYLSDPRIELAEENILI
jgi:hypothetical protein